VRLISVLHNAGQTGYRSWKTLLLLYRSVSQGMENLCPVQQCKTWLAGIVTSQFNCSRRTETTFKQLQIINIIARDRNKTQVTYFSLHWSSGMMALSKSMQVITASGRMKCSCIFYEGEHKTNEAKNISSPCPLWLPQGLPQA
jgi:hypothetical protein